MINLKDYDVLLIDLWGVVHDGSHLYPGVIEALYKLRELRKRVIFISNVPRRKVAIQELLTSLGINRYLYEDLIVSGELVYTLLSTKTTFGNKYFYLGDLKSEEVILNIKGYKKVQNAQNADFIIMTGIIKYFDKIISKIKEIAHYKIPMICTNPDKSSIKTNGEVVYCPGIIAQEYEELGGKVFYFGKPYKEIYKYALKNITMHKKILVIGDSIENDIKGAMNMGFDSILICSGIHRHELKITVGTHPDKKNLLKLYKKYFAKPTFVLSVLSDIVQF